LRNTPDRGQNVESISCYTIFLTKKGVATPVRIAYFVISHSGGPTMTRLTAKDFDPKLLELYDFYDHGKITKREFLDGAAKFAVAGMTATTILGLMSPNYALAEQVLGFKHQVQRLI
jgi:hypothetical protein